MLEPLIRWFEANQRPLPWRTSYDPYQVWISEVMLQQTQVETALPYFERFIRELPSIEALAQADEERVLTLWAGLGYYRRAKNLMTAARLVVEKHGGALPSDYDALLASTCPVRFSVLHSINPIRWWTETSGACSRACMGGWKPIPKRCGTQPPAPSAKASLGWSIRL